MREEEYDDLLHFYHKDTLREIISLKEYLLQREKDGKIDNIDGWIRMVAINRLTGHSSGFFLYTPCLQIKRLQQNVKRKSMNKGSKSQNTGQSNLV